MQSKSQFIIQKYKNLFMIIICGQNFQWVKIAPCQAKIKSSWTEIYPHFSLNLGVDCKKLPVCDDEEEDDSLDIGALG